jgi:hypothetical protein
VARAVKAAALRTLAPPLLAPRLTPSAAATVVRRAAGAPRSLAPWTAFRSSGEDDHPLVVRLEATVAAQDAALAGCAPAWERLMRTHIQATVAQVRGWIAQALDTGDVGQVRALVAALERRLGEWPVGAEQRLDEAQEDLRCTEREAEMVLANLRSLLEEMPRRSLREAAGPLLDPRRWPWLWCCWRGVQALYARYLQLHAATLETRLVIEQMVRVCGVYWAVGAELQSMSRALDRLEQGPCDLSARLPVDSQRLTPNN